MLISMRHIEIFHAVMTVGSLTKAAELLRTSQPTLSRELAALEDRLAYKLFERRSRQLFATDKALKLHAEVKRSYFGLDHLVKVAESLRDEADQLLTIGCMPMFATSLIPRVLPRLLAENPTFRLGLYPIDHSILLRDLMALRFELGITELSVPVSGMDVVEVPAGEDVCILPVGHPLAEKKRISLEDLHGQTLVAVPQADSYGARYERLFPEQFAMRNIQVEVPLADAIIAMVRQGTGIALVNPFTAHANRGAGIIIRPLTVKLPFSVGICRPLGRPLSALATRASELIADECQRIIAEIKAVHPG